MVAWKVEHVRPLPGYKLEVTFADGLRGVVDLSDVPHVGVFEPCPCQDILSRFVSMPRCGPSAGPTART